MASIDHDSKVSERWTTHESEFSDHSEILKDERTIADHEAAEEIRTEHIAEEKQYRSLDRTRWA